jgi:hypothetical protein
MPSFRNIENDGYWQAGGTYTFEVWTEGFLQPTGNPNEFHVWGYDLVEFNDVFTSCLFDAANEDFNDGVQVTNYAWVSEVDVDEDGNGWHLWLITLPSDLENGTYYLKHAAYDSIETIT